MAPHSARLVCVSCCAMFLMGNTSAAPGDFDGDGRDDLVVSVTREDVDGVGNSGAVHIIFGTGNGLESAGDEFWHRNVAGVQGACGTLERFGWATAWGDFDGDGFDDLAVSAKETGSTPRASVSILYGTANGLTASGDQLWSRDSAGVKGPGEDFTDFGFSLATGDFDGDGFDDLAIGVPFDTVDGVQGAGAVNVLYGGPNGLSAVNDQLFTQNTPGVRGVSEIADLFGGSLAVGDFDGDGRDDLAIGVSREPDGLETEVGAVNVLYGSNNGLSAAGDQLWHESVPGVTGATEGGTFLGWTLAAGDFDDDGRDDLAIGILQEQIDGVVGGAVLVLYGSSSGLTASGDQVWHQNVAGIPSGANSFEFFGSALAAGDFDGDGRDDLAIGVPYDLVDGIAIGAIHVLFGSNNGLRAVGDQYLHQERAGIKGEGEALGRFGQQLQAGDFDDDGRDDLAVFAPYVDVNGVSDAGTSTVFYGSNSGLSTGNEQVWSQNSPGIANSPGGTDLFGESSPGDPD